MALEELIVAWSKERPAWQRAVMRRVAAGDVLSDDDYDKLVDSIVSAIEPADSEFDLEQLPQTAAEDLPVRLISIANPEHVNALESPDPLTLAPKGLTIVYGDNASGKSGYARLLKRIARARHQEEVLTDVFRDTAVVKPSALLTGEIGDRQESFVWPEDSHPELQRMLFYDAACGNAYIANESDFLFRPSALFVMDGLISACLAVRARVDAKLAANAIAANAVPTVPDLARDSTAGRFLSTLSGNSPVEALDALIAEFDATSETVKELVNQEASLQSADTTKARQQLQRQNAKLDALRKHLEGLNAVLGSPALAELQNRRESLKALEEAASLLAQSFESEPLAGVGSSAWNALWESARRYSSEHAYPGHEFPFLGKECRCVLCHQSLEVHGRDRLARFDTFIRNDTQTRLQEAKRTYDSQVRDLQHLTVSPDVVTSNLTDLESTHRDLVKEIRELLVMHEHLLGRVRSALSSAADIPHVGIEQEAIIKHIANASDAARAAADDLANPEGIRKQLAEVTAKRARFELLEQVKKSRPAIVKEVARLKDRDALEAVKSAAATTGITKKVAELSEESITEVVRDAFTRETERLQLERVTIARTRADKGALLHQPKLVGARQQVTLPRVFSEGERTALGLAAFFTEAQLDPSKSALILDDPVTSLDHVRRALVASRLATLAESRQVIVFTHDVAFVADLKLEANGKGVEVCERSVARSRANERKPGVCSATHPWKAKDVPARLDELGREVARIKKDCVNWDSKAYEDAVAIWAGNLSETWERIFSQEIVGPVLADGGLEVRPMMVKVLTRFSEQDQAEFEASYGRVSQWAKRHDKSALVNYVAPDVAVLEAELAQVGQWFKRVKGYKA